MNSNETVDRILSEYDRDAKLYTRLCAEVEDLLTKVLKTSDIRISAVTSRLKERDSFERKVRAAPESKYGSARSVTDMAGARVVTYFADDVDRVNSIIRDITSTSMCSIQSTSDECYEVTNLDISPSILWHRSMTNDFL